MNATSPVERVRYLLAKKEQLDEELTNVHAAIDEARDEWARELSPFKLGDVIEVRGTPTWKGKVLEIRATRGMEMDAVPVVVTTVGYVRADDSLGMRRMTFYGDRDMHGRWKLQPFPTPAAEPRS